jgi:hypothetical protein
MLRRLITIHIKQQAGTYVHHADWPRFVAIVVWLREREKKKKERKKLIKRAQTKTR